MHSSIPCGPHIHRSCMRQQHAPQHRQQPLLQVAPSSNCKPGVLPPHNSVLLAQSNRNRSNSIVVRAKPDKGSLAALEAAIGAINGILGAHNKSRQQKQKHQGTGPGQQDSAAAAKAPPGPSKLISFSAKASGSVPVKEWYKIQDDPVDSESSSGSSSSNGSNGSSSGVHTHQPGSSSGTKPASTSSSKQHWHVPSKPPAVSEWQRSLQAYLSLPLEQYSVLDPSLVTRLPPGTDTELLLKKLLAARKERREQQQKQKQQQAQAAGEDSSSSSSSSSGTSLEPKMRQLEEQAGAAEQSSSSNGVPSSNGVSGGSSSNGTVSSTTATSSSSQSDQAQAEVAAAAAESTSGTPSSLSAAAAAAAAADAGEAGGSFLLRIPMQDLVGIALEPLLIITVDIDPVHGQVKFHASRLVVGDERFDAEFKVDLQAVMSSKITKQPHIVHAGADHGAPSDAAAVSSNGSSSGSGQAVVAVPGTVTAGAAVTSSSSIEGGTAVATATATASSAVAVAESPTVVRQDEQQQQQQQQQRQALYWQRTSALSCKVTLSMTLRLPHPLSIVPGPLLSTTASLVAKLVMQSLLPSFLELLATDYGRWATGSSRAAPVGSLVAAGKAHIKQQQQQQ